VPDVGKHRLYRGEAAAIQTSASFRINGPLHALGVTPRSAGRLAVEEADLPGLERWTSQVSSGTEVAQFLAHHSRRDTPCDAHQ
jgi:hypothetical protein